LNAARLWSHAREHAARVEGTRTVQARGARGRRGMGPGAVRGTRGHGRGHGQGRGQGAAETHGRGHGRARDGARPGARQGTAGARGTTGEGVGRASRGHTGRKKGRGRERERERERECSPRVSKLWRSPSPNPRAPRGEGERWEREREVVAWEKSN
jgi:hypothetical protein